MTLYPTQNLGDFHEVVILHHDVTSHAGGLLMYTVFFPNANWTSTVFWPDFREYGSKPKADPPSHKTDIIQ